MDELAVGPPHDPDKRQMGIEPMWILAESHRLRLLFGQRCQTRLPLIELRPQPRQHLAGRWRKFHRLLEFLLTTEGPLPAHRKSRVEVIDPPGDRRNRRRIWIGSAKSSTHSAAP